ncbi:MAG: type II secretion system protein [Candidatus Paceibacterota bacterium]
MKNYFLKKGFTVIEALVAISILLLSITGTFAVAQSSLQSTNYAKNKITAYYLAQEGIEQIRHLRDNNGLEMLKNRSEDVSWLNGFAKDQNDPCYGDQECFVDSTGELSDPEGNPLYGKPLPCPAEGCPLFYMNDITGQFQYESNLNKTQSSFYREISIFREDGDPQDNGENQIVVKVRVNWKQNGIDRSVEVSENLYNWQQLKDLDY